MTITSMTFHENYGSLPTALLKVYKRFNVSTSDHDLILLACGTSWSMANGGSPTDWSTVLEFVLAHIENGSFRLPLYL